MPTRTIRPSHTFQRAICKVQKSAPHYRNLLHTRKNIQVIVRVKIAFCSCSSLGRAGTEALSVSYDR